jgi:DNA-directed RNA polymerase specialized sigma24 family protein
VLRLQQGLSYKQIAEVMDLSVSHVGVLIHQAVTRLKHCVADI